MNKSEQREVEMIRKYICLGMDDTAARALSALIRAARTSKSRAALMALAGPSGWGLINHPEFTI
jgi:hypothetical protein